MKRDQTDRTDCVKDTLHSMANRNNRHKIKSTFAGWSFVMSFQCFRRVEMRTQQWGRRGAPVHTGTPFLNKPPELPWDSLSSQLQQTQQQTGRQTNANITHTWVRKHTLMRTNLPVAKGATRSVVWAKVKGRHGAGGSTYWALSWYTNPGEESFYWPKYVWLYCVVKV